MEEYDYFVKNIRIFTAGSFLTVCLQTPVMSRDGSLDNGPEWYGNGACCREREAGPGLPAWLRPLC